jgi:hypothetical protein
VAGHHYASADACPNCGRTSARLDSRNEVGLPEHHVTETPATPGWWHSATRHRAGRSSRRILGLTLRPRQTRQKRCNKILLLLTALIFDAIAIKADFPQTHTKREKIIG